MINRRKFLEAGAAVGVGAMLPLKVAKAAEAASRTASRAAGSAAPAGTSPSLTKFIDDLPIPIGSNFTYQKTGTIGGVPYYEIPITAFTQTLHSQLQPTHLWGYGGTYPSRTIEAVIGQPIRIRWRNDLIIPNPSIGIVGNPHPLVSSIDRVNVDGVDGFPDQRISTHLHGGHVPWTSDGGPKAWYTTGSRPMTFDNTAHSTNPYDANIKYFNGDTYDYPNDQLGTTLWFHDHAMGITRLNVMAGLAGFYLLRDANERSLNLPQFPYEIPLAIQDRTFNSATPDYPFNDLFYPAPPEVPEFFGDTMLVNGKVWPKLSVEPRKYRFRILNGCNARFLRMQLVKTTDGTVPSTRDWVNLPFVQIGAEGGFMPKPTDPFNTLLLAPAERADVIIDFSQFEGKSFLLYNDASTPFGNTADTRGAIPQVMRFDVVTPLKGRDTSTIPTSFDGFGFTAANAPIITSSTPTKLKTLDEIKQKGMLKQLINLVGYEKDPFTGQFVKPDVAYIGDTEVWEYVNTTVDVHPIHTHQTMFQVLSRQPYDAAAYQKARNGMTIDPTPYLLGSPSDPAPNETGWKDTVKANPGEVTRIGIRWEGAAYTGHYVYHCHILEHEEHDMMRALDILPAV